MRLPLDVRLALAWTTPGCSLRERRHIQRLGFQTGLFSEMSEEGGKMVEEDSGGDE